MAITGEDSFYILKYNREAVENANPAEVTADGIEDAFDVIGSFAHSCLVHIPLEKSYIGTFVALGSKIYQELSFFPFRRCIKKPHEILFVNVHVTFCSTHS